MFKSLRNFLIVSLCLIYSPLLAQNLSNLNFGTSGTFDVITWNLENFPKVDGITENYVSQIITELEAEVIGFQEISDIDAFDAMMSSTSGYSGYVLDANYGGINLAYAIKSDVTVLDDYAIFSSSNYNYTFAGRPPYLIHVEINTIEYYIINIHLKCCGNGTLDENNSSDEETRRLNALNYIKSYIDSYLSNKNVLVIGDYNDELNDDEEDNVCQNFIDDSDNYLFADMTIANGNPQNFSFPNWPSHLDHILISNELFNEYNSTASDVMTIAVDDYINGGFNAYDSQITDHMPVGIRLVYANGCTDPEALNYNSEATIDDGSCTYDTGDETAVLFISEYAEGSSNNKYLEIYNPTSSAVSLDDYAMAIVVNAPAQVGVYDSWHYFNAGSIVPANGVFVVAHPSSNPTILASADMITTHLSNGDDGIALVYGNQPSSNVSPSVGGYTVVDRIGDWNGDPGSAWPVAGISNGTKDHTLIRKCYVNQGNPDWTASSGTNSENSEWEVLANNDWTNLGSHYYPCEVIIEGCTDPASINYNADATVDDGSCICCYLGCTDELAINYNPNAYFNDGSCEYVIGCMDDEACNFNNEATQEDNSLCQYAPTYYDCLGHCINDVNSNALCDETEVQGCTDSQAINYNPLATFDNNSCEYTPSACDIIPTGLMVNNIIHNRVQFNWNQPSALPSYYMIRYRIVGSSSWTVIAAGTPNINPYAGTSRNRFFMQENSTYEWSVRSRVVNPSGSIECQSAWSENSTFTTLPNCANLENLSVNSEANWVNFYADEPDGDWNIWQSKAKVRASGTNLYRYVNGTNSINALKGNFNPNTEYEWHTKAWCTANVDSDGNSDPMYHSGWGEFSTFHTQEICDKLPTNLSTNSNTANTSITMSWDTPESGIPDHYFLELTNINTEQVWAWNNLSGNSNSKTKYNLPNGQYNWRIRGACGTNGTSWATPFSSYQYYTLGGNKLSNRKLKLLSLYPNPSRNYFNLSLYSDESQSITIKITNAIGQIIIHEKVKIKGSLNKVLDMHTLPKGIYQLQIISTNNTIQHKLILH